MLIVILQGRVAAGIIKQEVDIMGKVGKDLAEMVLQRRGKGNVSLRIQLSLHLSRDIRHQLQLIFNLRGLTVALVLIDKTTACKKQRSKEDEEQEMTAMGNERKAHSLHLPICHHSFLHLSSKHLFWGIPWEFLFPVWEFLFPPWEFFVPAVGKIAP